MFKPNNLELELDLTSKTIKWVEIKSQTKRQIPIKGSCYTKPSRKGLS